MKGDTLKKRIAEAKRLIAKRPAWLKERKTSGNSSE